MDEAWAPLFDTVGSALVSLNWSEVRLARPGERAKLKNADLSVHHVMGTIVSIRGGWAVLTAAHAVRLAMPDRTKGRRAFKFLLQVGFSDSEHGIQSIPFEFDERAVQIFEDESTGEDLAFVLLESETHKLLADAGANCVSDGMFASASERFDAYAVPGIVDELTQVKASRGSGRIEAVFGFTVPMLPIEPMDEYPIEYRDRDKNMFLAGSVVSLRGILPNGESREITSLAGMSGSPVYGIRIDDAGLAIRLVGVQSEFIREDSVIGASCPYIRMRQLVARSLANRAGRPV